MVPQPSVYSKSQIVEAAFALLSEKGWGAVSTRSIAERIGSSTMPIYSHFKSLQELEKELRQKAQQLLKEYQQKRHTEHLLLNLAFGYVLFARDERRLFQFLYQERPEKKEWETITGMKDIFFSTFGEESEEGKALLEIEEGGQEVLVRYTWIFTHGLATMANSGALDTCSDQLILQYLMDAGEAFYSWGIKQGEEGSSPEKR